MYRGCSRRKDGNLPPPGPPRTVDLYSGKKKKTYLQSKRERRREEGEAEEEDDDEQSAGEEPGGGSPSRADGATAPPRPLIPSHLGGYVASPPRPRPIADGTAAVLSKVSALRLELPLLASETAWRQALRRAAKSAEALASLEVSPEEAALSGAPLAIFEMLQQCLQSGPLRGGKPGYFKRCMNSVWPRCSVRCSWFHRWFARSSNRLDVVGETAGCTGEVVKGCRESSCQGLGACSARFCR